MEKFIKLGYSEVKTKKISDFNSSFKVEPLERGMANTLGNSMRRVLLSSVSGVAPFAIKIEGAIHEFQTLKDVTEDVVQLILNVKEITFRYDRNIFKDGEIITVSLKSPKGEVKAKDLILPPGVEVVNTEQFIATTSKIGALSFELFLTSGRGFQSFEQNKLYVKISQTKLESKLKSGQFIAMDSDFTPIKKVSFDTAELNSSAPIIQESLVLNVKTDGSVPAAEAVAQAANILIAHLEIMQGVENLKEEVFELAPVVEEQSKSLSLSISALDLSVRSYNSLKRAGYNKVAELSSLTLSELESIKNLGKKSVQEIIEKLEENGIILTDGGME